MNTIPSTAATPVNPFIAAIAASFAAELSAVQKKYPGYDPFRDHYPESHPNGKSYFAAINPEDSYLRLDNGTKIISETSPNPETKILTLRFTAEYYDPDEGGLAGAYGPESGYTWKEPCGWYVQTVPVNRYDAPEVKIKEGHGELQFYGRASEWTTEEVESIEATVVLSKEDDMWLLATAFPGPAGVHNDPQLVKELAEREHVYIDQLPAGADDTSHVILVDDEEFDKEEEA